MNCDTSPSTVPPLAKRKRASYWPRIQPTLMSETRSSGGKAAAAGGVDVEGGDGGGHGGGEAFGATESMLFPHGGPDCDGRLGGAVGGCRVNAVAVTTALPAVRAAPGRAAMELLRRDASNSTSAVAVATVAPAQAIATTAAAVEVTRALMAIETAMSVVTASEETRRRHQRRRRCWT